ncbi:uncharacterized protein [Temnothorax longispinosus]|uniref:uncharacterized protein n=1 Tax=Temnothorax longispinosus TaxID=300112 RepID=UPI003A98EEAB
MRTTRRKSQLKSHLSLLLLFLIFAFYIRRSLDTINWMKNNIDLFQSVCNHRDVPRYIIHFLYAYPTMVKSHDFTSEKNKHEVWTTMLTLLSYCAKPEIQHFLETYLIKKSSADNNLYGEYKSLLSHMIIEMILLEDADLYAVIYYLKISENCRYLSKIWVPQSIRSNFLFLRNKYFTSLSSAIRIFKSKQELLTPPTFYKVNVTSVWSEDMTAARNLATSLDRNIILINTLDFYESMTTMPHVEIFKISLHRHLELDENQHIINTIKPVYKPGKEYPDVPKNRHSLLFYDGTWQTPVEGMYWPNKDVLTAKATSDDIGRCVVSARKGFETWSKWSTESRMKVLSKFSSALKYNGKVKLSKIVQKWTTFPRLYKDSLIPQYPPLWVTIIRIRKPKGVITLMEQNETDLFRKLAQSLIIGNSVIVICTKQSCDLAPYCDMFSTSGIPPGVINLLSFENVKSLSEGYNASEPSDVYRQFTVSKQIGIIIY